MTYDLTMCNGKGCKKRATCLRAKTYNKYKKTSPQSLPMYQWWRFQRDVNGIWRSNYGNNRFYNRNKKVVIMEYTKGTKVKHKTKGMVETIIGFCKVKYMGKWIDGVIYEGNDTNTGKPMTFVRIKEDFENNFEAI